MTSTATDRLPDFVLIGSMKCGTSTLAVQLAAQKGVFVTTPKEPNFFSDDEIYSRGLDWYRALFDAARPGDIRGEASTHYTKLPTYPDTLARMQVVLTAPKLIYMIRNPVTRAVSHYIHEWSEGRMGHDPLAEFARHSEMLDYGRYGWQITPFIEAYGRDAVLLTSLEGLKSDPQGELTRVAAHIGLERAEWKDDLGAQNVSAERVRKFPMQKLLIDNPVAETLRRTLVPRSLREKIRKSRTIRERPELPDDLRARLEAAFLKDRDVLAGHFPDHPALTQCYPFAGQAAAQAVHA